MGSSRRFLTLPIVDCGEETPRPNPHRRLRRLGSVPLAPRTSTSSDSRSQRLETLPNPRPASRAFWIRACPRPTASYLHQSRAPVSILQYRWFHDCFFLCRKIHFFVAKSTKKLSQLELLFCIKYLPNRCRLGLPLTL